MILFNRTAQQHNPVQGVTLRYTPNGGISIAGSGVTARDLLIEYTDWLGTLDYKPVHQTIIIIYYY